MKNKELLFVFQIYILSKKEIEKNSFFNYILLFYKNNLQAFIILI